MIVLGHVLWYPGGEVYSFTAEPASSNYTELEKHMLRESASPLLITVTDEALSSKQVTVCLCVCVSRHAQHDCGLAATPSGPSGVGWDLWIGQFRCTEACRPHWSRLLLAGLQSVCTSTSPPHTTFHINNTHKKLRSTCLA